MRFMVLVRANKDTEAGLPPDNEIVAAATKLNHEMAKAGVLLAAGRLLPSAMGARIKFTGTRPRVTDGPFTETKELIAGFSLIQVRSKEEAIEWASRFPLREGREIEVRQLSEAADLDRILPGERSNAAGA